MIATFQQNEKTKWSQNRFCIEEVWSGMETRKSTWAENSRRPMARCPIGSVEHFKEVLFQRLKRLMKEKTTGKKKIFLEIIKKDSLPSMEKIYANYQGFP